MMPGTISLRHAEAVTVEATTPIDVRDLTGAERTVALFASDMPSARRRHTKDQIRAWIVQGVERLGMDEVQRRAEYLRGWRLLDLEGLVTAQIQALHEQRFPRPRRLNNAETEAAGSVFVHGMSRAAQVRNGWAVVDGECPCGRTGDIDVWGGDPDASWRQVCPVHCQTEIVVDHRDHRAAL
ncbi:hypothetical protein ACWD5R_36945 [Streptomyces sp. NPDC002514]|uniref:hypothetical protein n=1 Tax=Streptomyces sp. NPDC001270 TaxID=3364554 RepID=UPI0036A3E911